MSRSAAAAKISYYHGYYHTDLLTARFESSLRLLDTTYGWSLSSALTGDSFGADSGSFAVDLGGSDQRALPSSHCNVVVVAW